MYFYQFRAIFGTLGLLLLLASCSSQRVASGSSPSRSASHARTAKKAERAAPAGEKAEQVISAARSYIGTPYRYGGIDKRGIDCSGLLLCSFKSANIPLPRTSTEQSSYGKPVSLYELKPGDLVFFSAKKWKGKVSHAGMVTEVRGKDEVIFIHSSSSKGVVESNLLSPYYREIFVKARRPF